MLEFGLQFLQNVALNDKTTFQMPANAAWYCEALSLEDVRAAGAFARDRNLPVLVLGGGSNLVLSSDLEGLVLANRIRGVSWSGNDVELGAGENWHGFVADAVSSGFGGFENLALIPGSCGAAPMQNIGAYGVELSERFLSLQALNLETDELVEFDRSECQFGYRHSRFKAEDHWCITAITLQSSNEIRAVYPGIEAYVSEQGKALSHESIFEAVCAIRQSKLPDVIHHPNAGSFFKNPVVTAEEAAALKARYSDIPAFPDGKGVKLSAAWLIEQTGLKGEQEGGFSVSTQHALVLEHDRHGRYEELARLTTRIRTRVSDRFGVDLDVEPTIYPVNT